MQQLTPDGEREVQNLAQRYGVSVDAVKAMLAAVSAGGGTMAQFYIQELGGGGQWMQGGMTMVGDMFNSRLQSTVSGLCADLSSLLASRQIFVPLPQNQAQNQGGWMSSGNSWWPSDLGHPSSSGGQNDARYAYFPNPRRLAIERSGHVTVYDTLDHQIGGVQQQQGGSYGSLSFSSQFGTFTVDSLPLANHPINPPPQPLQQQPAPPPYSPPPMPQSAPQQTGNMGSPHSREDVLATLERLGQLHGKGILSDDEFQSKKAELLARL